MDNNAIPQRVNSPVNIPVDNYIYNTFATFGKKSHNYSS